LTIKLEGEELLSEEAFVALSSKCPNVVNLEIDSWQGIDVISWSLKYFPQLKTIMCGFIGSGDAFPNYVAHQKLKKLKVGYFERSLELLFLFGCIEDLEVFEIGMKIRWKDLQMILNLPRLKALCLKRSPFVDEGFIKTMKKYGQNLESFHVQDLVRGENDVSLSPEELREEFKDQFPIFSFKAGKKWTMKKRNKKMICCDN
jgi:hypothetical protein